MKILTFTFFSSFLITSVFSQQQGTSFDEANRTKKAEFIYIYETLTHSEEYPNGLIYNNNGEFVGVLPTLVEAFEAYVKKEYGIIVTSKFINPATSFAGFLNEIKTSAGGVFGLSSISITDERKKQMSFSPTFLNNIDVMVTHKDVPTLTSLQTIDSEFKGKTAYSIPSTTYYHTIESLKKESFPSLVIKPVQTPIDVLNKASSDENSFGYVDFILYLRSLENRKSIKRHPIADVASDQYGIAMPLKSDWASIIKDFFDTGYLQSLDYRKAITNHIGNQALRMVK